METFNNEEQNFEPKKERKEENRKNPENPQPKSSIEK